MSSVLILSTTVYYFMNICELKQFGSEKGGEIEKCAFGLTIVAQRYEGFSLKFEILLHFFVCFFLVPNCLNKLF